MIGKLVTILILVAIAAPVWLSLDTSYLDKPAASITGWDSWGWDYAIGWRTVVTLILGFFAWAVIAAPVKK